MNANCKSQRLPDFIGLGMRRCGSSWLHRVLNTNPEIGKPDSGLHYFSSEEGKDIEWYIENLQPYASAKVLLEFSVSYSYPEYAQQAAEKMHREIPDAQLFVCVRNPVQRAYSDFLRSKRMDELPADLPFESCIDSHAEFMDRGRYASILKPYLEYYSSDKLKICFYDDLKDNPWLIVEQMAEFLGVSNNFDMDIVTRAEPKAKTVRSETLNKSIRGIKGFVDHVADGLGQTTRWASWKARQVHAYERILELTYRNQALDPVFARQLAHEFDDDISFLEKFTRRDLRSWYEF